VGVALTAESSQTGTTWLDGAPHSFVYSHNDRMSRR
jgi:hypothetical protein